MVIQLFKFVNFLIAFALTIITVVSVIISEYRYGTLMMEKEIDTSLFMQVYGVHGIVYVMGLWCVMLAMMKGRISKRNLAFWGFLACVIAELSAVIFFGSFLGMLHLLVAAKFIAELAGFQAENIMRGQALLFLFTGFTAYGFFQTMLLSSSEKQSSN